MLIDNINLLPAILNGAWVNTPSDGFSPNIVVKRPSDRVRKVPNNAIVIFEKKVDGDGEDNKLKIRRPLKAKNVCYVVDSDCAVDCLEDIPVLRVDLSMKEARRKLARYARGKFKGKVIAVTGSVGKTTTKNILFDVLSNKHDTYIGVKSHNTINMVVGQMLSLKKNEDYAIIELDRYSTLSGSKLAKPYIAIFTSLAEAHLGKHGTLEEIAHVKSRMFRALEKGGVAIINRDIPYFSIVEGVAKKYASKIITYGENEGEIHLISYCEASNVVKVKAFEEVFSYTLGVDGLHNAINSLAVLATLYALDLNVKEFIGFFKDVMPVQGRGSISELEIDDKRVRFINDAYNANPLSMNASLATFKSQVHPGRKILCLGDMLELGDDSVKFHSDLMGPVLAAQPDKVFLVGSHMEHLWKLLPESIRGAHFMTADKLEEALKEELLDNDLVLFKSSNATNLFDVCESLSAQYKIGGDD